MQFQIGPNTWTRVRSCNINHYILFISSKCHVCMYEKREEMMQEGVAVEVVDQVAVLKQANVITLSSRLVL